jgi:S-DNA-T family DNA segregation ATPase FtsK/SpoIIIE
VSSTSVLIGRLLARIVKEEFTSKDESDPSSGSGLPAMHIVGFQIPEIEVLVDELEGWCIPGLDNPIEIVVGSRNLVQLEKFQMAADRTLTDYRNHNASGLILVAIDAQSDEQGLKQMHRVADSGVLGVPTREELRRRLTWLTEFAWTVASRPNGMSLPGVFEGELADLHQWFESAARPALRSWVPFVSRCAELLAESQRAITMEEVRGVLSSELHHLLLFPDEFLYDRSGASERRLQRNQHLAELRNPLGRELRDDDLAARIESVVLHDRANSPLEGEESNRIREQMRSIQASGGPSPAHHVQLVHWEQLFEKGSKSNGLGKLVRQSILATHPTRLEEFNDLDVEEGLDEGDGQAAETLVTAASIGDQPPLIDLLPSTLRKKIDRLIFRGEHAASDPLIAILNGINADNFERTDPEDGVIELVWERFDTRGSFSAKLFGFLYGRTLEEIQDASEDSMGIQFRVDPDLLVPGDMGSVFEAIQSAEEGGDAEDGDLSECWAPLQLSLRTPDSKTPLIRFRWSPQDLPGLVLFARMVVGGGARGRLEGPPLLEWAQRTLESWEPMDPSGGLGEGLTRRWGEVAVDHLSRMGEDGISASAIADYLDEWIPLIEEARNELVPHGSPLTELDRFLTYETAECQDGHLVILATHPIRLRWLGDHLRHMSNYLGSALDGELTLNRENDQLFFEWLGRVSPHRQPPVASRSKALLTAVREVGLHEEYASAASTGNDIPEWLSSVDETSVDEIVASVRSFVSAFPHKTSGLSVLILSHASAAPLTRRFVDQLRRRELGSLDLELHVLTRFEHHEEVAEALSGFDSDDQRGQALLPSFRLVLHDWGSDVGKVLSDLSGRIDIAIAPNLFGLHTVPLAETRRRESGLGGSFDPWIDRTSYSRPPSKGGINISQVLLPVTPDPVLEAWSTLSVRRHHQQPMNAEDPEGTDFFTLQVQFDQNQDLFRQLHSVANWVITLDPFIGRDQVDALESAPDVITVKPNVGKNQEYTMVVSSSAGKAWVTRRLAARLHNDFGFEHERALDVAARLYEIGRHVVPGLMLRAVGLGRTVEEILGLILARFAVAESEGSENGAQGVEFWISLDEHTEWFGGAQRTRPDLLRVRVRSVAEETTLDFLVLESKFRQSVELGAADDQVTRAVRLISDAFAAGDREAPEHSDARFWRRELLAATDQLSRRSASPADLPAIRRFTSEPSDSMIRDDVQSGRYRCGEILGTVCVTSWSTDVGDRSTFTTDGGHPVLVIDRTKARAIIEAIERREDPFHFSEAVTPGGAVVERDQNLESLQDGLPPVSTPSKVPDLDATIALGTTHHPAPVGDTHERSPSEPVPDSEPVAESLDAERRERAKQERLSTVDLENSLQRILDRLSELSISVKRDGHHPFQEGPGFCLFRVVPAVGIAADRVTSKLEDLKLALELPAEMSIRSYVDRGAVVFEVPKDDGDRYYVRAEDLWLEVDDDDVTLSIPIGEDISGDIVNLDFSSSDTPHLLIAGQTGSGKSVALEAILKGLCTRKGPDSLHLVLVDGKGTELGDLEGDPHVLGEIGWMPEDAIEKLELAVNEMSRRYELFRQEKCKSIGQFNEKFGTDGRIPWWLVVLDEYADLTADPDDRKTIEGLLKRVAQKGRAAGIHLIVATQKPSAEVISTVIRSNLPAQLALRVKSASDSRIILDESGAETLAGKGDGFLKTAKGMTRVQSAMVDHE